MTCALFSSRSERARRLQPPSSYEALSGQPLLRAVILRTRAGVCTALMSSLKATCSFHPPPARSRAEHLVAAHAVGFLR